MKVSFFAFTALALGASAAPAASKQKFSQATVMWNPQYIKPNTLEQFSHTWRYLCETVVAPIHQHHSSYATAGPAPNTAIVQCLGHQTTGDLNVEVKGGQTWDQTQATLALAHSWGWAWAYVPPAKTH